MLSSSLSQLQQRVERLIVRYQKLQRENNRLKQAQQSWEADHVHLSRQNKLARQKLTEMIVRLKTLEYEQE